MPPRGVLGFDDEISWSKNRAGEEVGAAVLVNLVEGFPCSSIAVWF